MVPQSILQRVFYIRYLERFLGSSFTFERNGTQFLATARHNFPHSTHGQELEFSIMRNNEWGQIGSRIFMHTNDQVDMVILQLPEDISPRHEITLDEKNLFLGQDSYFLGFPYKRYMDVPQNANNGYPLPFVKKAIFSAAPYIDNGVHIIFLDGMNNPGFSGGPCVYINKNTTITSICGVVKGFLPHYVQVTGPLGRQFEFEENSGIVEVHSIGHLNEIKTY